MAQFIISGVCRHIDHGFFGRLVHLLQVASNARTAMMRAEALWWRCHRLLIADELSVRGIEVVHILNGKHSVAHPMTSPARTIRGRLNYFAAES